MVRTAIASPTQLTNGQAVTAGQVVAYQAADNTNHNQVKMSGGDLLLIRNATGAGVAVTIHSVADVYGRTLDIAETIAANTVKVYGPFRQAGWQQSDGTLYIDAATGLDLAVIRLP